MKTSLIAALAFLVLTASDGFAQARGRGTAASSARQPRTTTVRVAVHDEGGSNLDGVRITLSGDATGEYTTAGAGTVIVPNLKAGTYRLHLEKEGFVTLEREFSLQDMAPKVVEVVLTPKPPPPPPPPPPPAPVKAALPPSGPPVSVSVVEFLDKNFIGRDPIRESVLACNPLETVRLLQLREALASHTHADADEVVYVVAGEGTAHVGERNIPLKPGTMVVIPHSLAHGFERQGRNALMVLSTLAGAACHEPAASR